MATPTPMKQLPSQQGRTPHTVAATPPVSTPFSASHAAFSPHGPRSSPQQVKKSPANSSTLMGHATNPPVNYDSPSAAAFGALGISSGLDLGLDNVGVGALGGLGSLGRSDDDERAKRFHNILGILKHGNGRVSESGLERLAKATGLETMWEEGMGSDKTRTLIIAGSALALDIVLANNVVNRVSLAFPESNEIVMRHVDKAGKILLEDIKLLSQQSPLTTKLDQFSANLEQLALLDKLSVIPQLNLHEAVAGIYESLERLFRWDLEKLRQDPALSGRGEESLVTTVLCTRHGVPLMHARGRIGLSLDYWREQRLIRPSHPNTRLFTESAEKIWSILIGCAPIQALAYQAVRVSDKWLSSEVERINPPDEELLTASAGPILDWQEPDAIILPAGAGSKPSDTVGGLSADASLSEPKLPEVMFSARFDPPVTVPLSTWGQIYQLVGLTAELDFAPVTFDSLSFPIAPDSNHDPSEPRMISCTKGVPFNDKDGEPAVRPHRNTLFIYKPVYGRTLEAVPFGHPSQLIRMLPTLRQYAFLSTLLEKSFETKMVDILQPEPGETRSTTTKTTTVQDEFTDFMDKPNGSSGPRAPGDAAQSKEGENTVFMDVVLSTHPVPRLQVVFPFRNGTADIMLDIRVNGLVHVVSQNVLDEDGEDTETVGKGKGKQLVAQDLGRLLEVCEDLGKWCEWIRSRCE